MSAELGSQNLELTDGKLRNIPLPYGDAIAEGVVPGHIGGHKFGANANVGTTEETIWPLSDGHTYFDNDAGEILQISSSDVNDTAAGSGARTIEVQGLANDGTYLAETVTMNGTTAVPTVGTYWRLNRVVVVTAGASLTNEGLISVKDNADVVTMGQIVAGRGQSQMAFTTSRANNNLFIKQIHAGESANKRVTVRLYARDTTVTDAAWQLKAEIVVNLSDVARDFFVPLKFGPEVDLELRAVSAITGGDVTAGFIFYEETAT
jgi:hypothetical protein